MKNPFQIAGCALAVGLLAAPLARAEDTKPDGEGYVRHWLMLAPVSLPEGDPAELVVKDQIEKESALAPKAGDTVKVNGKELAWKSVHSETAEFDFNALLGSQNENVAGYMVAYLVCDKELADVTVLSASNDEGRLYLNGKEILKDTEPGPLEKDSDKVEHVTLKKGVNTIVFKVINESNNWQGSLRFVGKDGKPVTDFTVKLSP